MNHLYINALVTCKASEARSHMRAMEPSDTKTSAY